MNERSAALRSVVVERVFAFPPERLWRALTTPHLIAEWLMKNDFAPEVGRLFKFHADWGGVLDCEVIAVEPPRTLAYSWDFAHHDPAFAVRTVVTFTLTPTAAGTHLRMEQTGFRAEQRQAYGGASAGWRRFLDRLGETAARGAAIAKEGDRLD